MQSYSPSGLTVTGSDAGLGMGTDTLNGPGLTSASGSGCGSGTCSATSPATGAYGNIAPSFTSPAWSFNAPEGIDDYTTTASDIIGNQTSTPYQVKVDSTPPTLQVAGGLQPSNGTAYVAADETDLTLHADDGGSGVTHVALLVDGQPADSTTQTCAPGGCSLDYPAADAALSDGKHTISALATDAAGNTTTLPSWTVNVDQTSPTATVSGSGYDAASQPSASGVLSLHVDASDPSSAGSSAVGSGVASIQTLVDGQPLSSGPTASQTCTQGACSLTADGTIDTSQLSAGGHTVSVEVTDAAGNVQTVPWSINVGTAPTYDKACAPAVPPATTSTGTPQTSAQAVLLAQLHTPSLLQAESSATAADGATVQPSFDATSTPVGERGNNTSATVSTGASGAFSIGTGSESVCLSPTSTTVAAGAGIVVNGNAVVFPNTAASTNTLLRPTAFGLEAFVQLTDATAPNTTTWNVALQPTQRLEAIGSHTVAVVDTALTADSDSPDPTGPATADAVVMNTAANPSNGSNVTDTQAQMAGQAQLLAAADTVVTDGQVVELLSAASAVDANGREVPTNFTADPSARTVSVAVNTSGGGFAYPITVDPAATDESDATTAALPPSHLEGAPNGFCSHHQLYSTGAGYSKVSKHGIYETSGDARGYHYYYAEIMGLGYECRTRFSEVLFHYMLDMRDIKSTTLDVAVNSVRADSAHCAFKFPNQDTGNTTRDGCRYEFPRGPFFTSASPGSDMSYCCYDPHQEVWIQYKRAPHLSDGINQVRLVTDPIRQRIRSAHPSGERWKSRRGQR